MIRVNASLKAKRIFLDEVPGALFVQDGETLTILALVENSPLVYCKNEFDQYGYVDRNIFEDPTVSTATTTGKSSATSPFDDNLTNQSPSVTAAKPTWQRAPVQRNLSIELERRLADINLKKVENWNLSQRPLPQIPPTPLPRSVTQNNTNPRQRNTTSSNQSGLEGEKWFVGKIDRVFSERLLSSASVGTFLVRESNTVGGYVISIKAGMNSYKHRKIEERNGKVCAFESYYYDSISRLVNSHIIPAGDNLLKTPYNKGEDKTSGLTHQNVPKSNHLPPPVLPINPLSQSNPQNRNRNPPLTIPSLFENVNRIPPQTPQPTSNPPPSTSNPPPPPAPPSTSNPPPLTAPSTKLPPPPPPPSKTGHPPQPNHQSSRPTIIRPTAAPPPAPPASSAKTPTREEQIYTPNADTKISDSLKEWIVKGSDITIEEVIGKGHYGHVKKGLLYNKKVALKTFNKGSMNLDQFLEEAEIMKDIQHPFLVKLYGVALEPRVYLIMEYHMNGNVESYLKRNHLNSEEKRRITLDVASGMSYLSQLNYIHRDLAARNVLLANNLTARIADFGLAKLMSSDINSQTGVKIAWRWMAPEVLTTSPEWSTSCDVWSYGVFCWELYTDCSQLPYHGHNLQSSYDLLGKIKYGSRLEKPTEMHEKMYKILLECWNENPEERIQFVNVMKRINEVPSTPNKLEYSANMYPVRKVAAYISGKRKTNR